MATSFDGDVNIENLHKRLLSVNNDPNHYPQTIAIIRLATQCPDNDSVASAKFLSLVIKGEPFVDGNAFDAILREEMGAISDGEFPYSENTESDRSFVTMSPKTMMKNGFTRSLGFDTGNTPKSDNLSS